jgi:flagellar biosynthetic protein FliQ
MSMELAIQLGQQTLLAVIILSGPILGVALIVGTIVSVIQAVTQIQEMTLVFVPKIIAVFLVIAVGGGAMLSQAVSFGITTFESIADVDY